MEPNKAKTWTCNPADTWKSHLSCGASPGCWKPSAKHPRTWLRDGSSQDFPSFSHGIFLFDKLYDYHGEYRQLSDRSSMDGPACYPHSR
jgi:hypothetical protein